MLSILSWSTFAVVILAYLLLAWLGKDKSKRLPPGPRGLPIIGHLHLLSKMPHLDFDRLAKLYGPIVSVRFGFVPHLIVSSAQAAEQFLKIQDLNFCSRPPSQAAKYAAWDQKNLSFSPYGPYWRDMRKLCTVELLNTSKVSSFEAMRRDEVCLLVEYLKRAAQQRVSVDLTKAVLATNIDMTCLMILGKKSMDKSFDDKGFKAVIKEGVQLSVIPNFADFFPFLGVLDLQGLKKRLKAINKAWDEFFEKILDEAAQSRKKGEHTKDVVNTMLDIMESGTAGFHFDRTHIKAILLDLLSAAMDTSAAAIDWILADLLKHPHVMKKLQKELDDVVGMNRMVEESDFERLEYLNMVVKESFRLHPIAPVLVPRLAREDTTVNGYHVPKGTRVFVNNWTICRDPNTWTDPDKFLPERFVGSSIDVRGRDFQVLPFGSGRRVCPGMQVGLTVVRLVVAQLAHCFYWELPNNMKPEDLDMTDEFGIVACRANHLLAIPSYRLNIQPQV